jgi:hypothetical protein
MNDDRTWGGTILVALPALLLVLLSLSLSPPPAAAATAAEPEHLSVSVGHPVFWAHPTAVTGDVANAGACTAATCPSWPLDVASGATQLRVGLDTPSREDGFQVELLDPKGAVAGSATASNQFDDEAFVASPVGGTWTVRVLPKGATDAPLRLRAGLDEGLPKSPAKGAELLPNLKAVPPMELGFVAPANPLNGLYPPDDVNPPLDVAGVHPVSCAPDEAAPVAAGGQGAVRCLRLTTGPINVGDGPFDMRFDLITDTSQLETEPATLRGPMRQAVHLAGGGIVERAAGKYSFHTTHGHFHTEQILTYELFAVADAQKGGLTKTGAGTKSGFCPADQLFGDFLVFQQAVPGAFGEGDSAAGGCSSPDGGSLGLTPGWGDVYRWQRPGQYVEFVGQPDGLYVIRSTVDKSNLVRETDDTDNAAYALARITGESIELIERGQGTDPWDPSRVVFCGAGPATRDAFGPKITSGVVCAASASNANPVNIPAVAPVAPTSAAPAAAPDAGVAGASTGRGTLPTTGTAPDLRLLVPALAAGFGLRWVNRRRLHGDRP